MKRTILFISLFTALLFISFGYVSLRSVPIKSNKLVWLCLNNHQLKITLIESADYLADCKGYASKDTLFLSVYTTPIFNPFISKVADTVVDIKPNIRYINIAHKTTSVASIHNCVGTHE